ncbi:MAG: helix-turn-helix domain-containing protein, partial [Actinobacteria bacterium]|nr:helix-turn-helix domain-containing protein [Actinomycetota bacterium]
GNQEGITIELTPLGSRSLLGMPAGELWDWSLELSEVVGATGDELWERLQHASGWEERFGICDRLLVRLARDDGPAPEMGRAWDLLVASRGGMPVGEIAREVGYSRQHLGQRFRSEFGLSPKLAARILRFDQARRMLAAVAPSVSIAQVAITCGYYDQAHLNRDFADLGGCTPTQLRDDFPAPPDEASTRLFSVH